jgi:hypothetical protein
MIDCAFVHKWSALYPARYDEQYYFPNLPKARQGDANALRAVTEWKNAGPGGRPVPFSRHRHKEAAFQRFLEGLPEYLRQGGSTRLREDFRRSAPVWSTFWHHILYGTPIFDVYTHMAWQRDATEDILTREEARICPPGHWLVYDRYTSWFQTTLGDLRRQDKQITERLLDRAMFSWGQSQH